MREGWSAKDLLKPLWHTYPGGRDALASAVGTTGTVLSSINSGKRNLGQDLGGRLAAELAITLPELGAPISASHPADLTLRQTLESLTEQVVRQGRLLERMSDELEQLQSEQAAPQPRQGNRRPARGSP